jgi:hypothetical protein
MGLRDSAISVAPPFLSDDSDTGVGGKLVYEDGLLPDALVDKMQQAVWARFPLGGTSGPSGGNGGPYQDALTHIGHDRNILQGVGEPLPAYGARLQGAFQAWQTAGTAQRVLQQILVTLQTQCRAAVVRAPAVLVMGTDTIEPYASEYGVGANQALPPAMWAPTSWYWDLGFQAVYTPGRYINNYPGCPPTIQAPWWRNWLVLWPTGSNNWTQPAGNWGDPGDTWGDTTSSWGLSCPPTTIATIQNILSTFKSAGAWYQWIVISFDDRFMNWGGASAYYPTDGTWAHWSKIVFLPLENRRVYVAARAPGLRYCDGAT